VNDFNVATVGPFARVAGTVLGAWVTPQAIDVINNWAPGTTVAGEPHIAWRFLNPGPAADSDPLLQIQNATGTPRTCDWVVFRIPL